MDELRTVETVSQAHEPGRQVGVSEKSFADNGSGEGDSNVMDMTLRSLIAKAETQAIRHALDHSGWNRRKAARLLNISYRGLLYKMRGHSITRTPR